MPKGLVLVLCFCIVILLAFWGGCEKANSKPLSNDQILELLDIQDLGFEVVKINLDNVDNESTTIFAELSVPEKAFSSNAYFKEKTYEISPGYTNDLINYGVEMTEITDFGINYKELIVQTEDGEEYRPYPIYWFKLDEALKSKSNVLLYAIVPNKITLANT